MTATAIDSLILRDVFSTEAMRRIFSDESRRRNIWTLRRHWRACRRASASFRRKLATRSSVIAQ